MAENIVIAERVIKAPAETVYRCLSDYQNHHANFLPSEFSGYRVEEGGVGSGTVVNVVITAGGRQRSYRLQVSEPQPGKVLQEKDTNSSLVTTFTVTPEGSDSRVRIETRWQGATGMKGFMEHLFAPPAMRKIYNKELDRLDEYASKQS